MATEIKDKTILEKFTRDFVKILEKYTKYIIVSGFVAILHGRSRGTEDIDIIIERIDLETFIKLHKNLLKKNFECLQSSKPEEIYKYLRNNLSVRYIRKDNLVPQIELKFSKDELDGYQLETRKKLPFTGTDFYFSSIEMNIAFKEELLKSDKDIEDAKHLRIIYGDKIDEKEIEKIKKEIRKLRL